MSTLHDHDADLRSQAIERLKKRSEFWSHLTVYVLFNALIVMVWFLTGAEFFWPIFPLAIWGIGLLFHAIDVFRRPISEERIRREMERLP
jgi:hypothetical protein